MERNNERHDAAFARLGRPAGREGGRKRGREGGSDLHSNHQTAEQK